MGVMDHVGVLDEHVARQIEHRRFERILHFFLELEVRRAVGHQRLVDRGLGRQDTQPFVGAHHRAFDEQPVDAAGIFDRIGQAAARLEVERQRAGAEMDIEIEQSGRAMRFLAE